MIGIFTTTIVFVAFECGSPSRFTERPVALDQGGRGFARWCEIQDAAGAPIRHGPFESYTLKGVLVERGLYQDGLESGRWEGFHSNGKVSWRGERFNGEDVGQWQLFHPNGRLRSEGQMLEGRREGVWLESNARGAELRELSYLRGQLEGPSTYFYPGGVVQRQGTYRDGEPPRFLEVVSFRRLATNGGWLQARASARHLVVVRRIGGHLAGL